MKLEEGLFFTDTRWENIPVHYINANVWDVFYSQFDLGKRYLLALCGKGEKELLYTAGIQMWKGNESLLFRLLVEFQTAGNLYGGVLAKVGEPILKWAKSHGINFSDFANFNRAMDWADHKYYGNVISNHRAIQSANYNTLLRTWGMAYPMMPKEQIWPKSAEHGFEAYEKAVRERQIAAKKAMEERAKAKKSQPSLQQTQLKNEGSRENTPENDVLPQDVLNQQYTGYNPGPNLRDYTFDWNGTNYYWTNNFIIQSGATTTVTTTTAPGSYHWEDPIVQYVSVEDL